MNTKSSKGGRSAADGKYSRRRAATYASRDSRIFEMDIPQELIDAVEAFAPELIWLAGITGVGIGLREENEELFDELAVRVLVADAAEVPDGVPDEIAGLPVCVVEFPVEPLFDADTRRYDDLPG